MSPATRKRPKPRSVAAMKSHAERMCRRIVMHRASKLTGEPLCERCCKAPGAEWAHIIPRRYSGTRCHQDNAWALCHACHVEVDRLPPLKIDLVGRTIGEERYWELWRMATDHTTAPITAYRWWMDEVERLRSLCEELGLDTRASR